MFARLPHTAQRWSDRPRPACGGRPL